MNSNTKLTSFSQNLLIRQGKYLEKINATNPSDIKGISSLRESLEKSVE